MYDLFWHERGVVKPFSLEAQCITLWSCDPAEVCSGTLLAFTVSLDSEAGVFCGGDVGDMPMQPLEGFARALGEVTCRSSKQKMHVYVLVGCLHGRSGGVPAGACQVVHGGLDATK